MIGSIRHRGLKAFYERGSARHLNSEQLPRIRRILTALDAAESIEGLDLPGWRLHTLKGDLKGFWSVTVSGNWRIIFRFKDGEVGDVDLVDYH